MPSSSSSPPVFIPRRHSDNSNENSNVNATSVGPDKQVMHLLALLGQHAPKLSHQHRAQHLVVIRSLLLSSSSISPAAWRQIPAAVFLALSKFIGTCQIHGNPVVEPDSLIALFALISAACACRPGDGFVQNKSDCMARSNHVPAFARVADDGLFANNNSNDYDDDDNDGMAISGVKLKSVRFGLRDATAEQDTTSLRASIAHLVVTACDAFCDSKQYGLRVRTMALGAISAFARVLPPNLLAVFFPGIASKLAKLLTRARLDQSILTVLAFDALSHLISRLFFLKSKNNSNKNNAGSSFSTILQAALHEKRINHSNNSTPFSDNDKKNSPKPHSIEVSERSDAWYGEASTRFSQALAAILESPDSARFHPNPNARLACAQFLAKCVLHSDAKSSLQLDPVVRAECLIVLFETAADSIDEPRDLAAGLIRNAIYTHLGYEQDVEKGLNALIRHVMRLEISRPFFAAQQEEEYKFGQDYNPHAHDDDDDSNEGVALRKTMRIQNPQLEEEHQWSKLLEGYLYVLGHRDDGNRSSPGLDILKRVNCENLAAILAVFQKAVFKPAAIALNQPVDYQILSNPALSACERLGKFGLLPSLQVCLTGMAQRQFDDNNNNNYEEEDEESDIPRHMDVVHLNDPEAFVNHSHVVQCLHWLTVGACAEFRERYIDSLRTPTESDDWEQLKRYAVVVLECAASCTLPVDEKTLYRWNNNNSFKKDGVPMRVKVGTLMCTAHLLEILGKLKIGGRRKVGFEIVMPTLLALLVDAARDEREVRKAAQLALEQLASALAYNNIQVLVQKHVNFIVARLTRNLHHNTWAAAVLKYIITSDDAGNGSSNNDICAQVINLAQDTLVQQCHDLAGASDYRAAVTLAALDAVLSTALVVRNNDNNNTVEKEEENNGRDPLQEEIDELTKHMMSFCTDEEKAGYQEGGIKEYKEENEEDEDEREKSAFEIIASTALAGIEDLLVGRPAQLRAQALRVANIGIQVLSIDDTQLLPCVARLLPLIPPQLTGPEEDKEIVIGIRKYRRSKKDKESEEEIVAVVNRLGRELEVISAACELTTQLVRSAKSFVQGRFIKMIFPKLRPLLKLLLIRHTDHVGFGALTAADNALHLLYQVALYLPNALAPFAAEITRYIIPYLNSNTSGVVSNNSTVMDTRYEGRRLLEIQRYRNRARCAHSIMIHALAKNGTQQDTVWSILAVEDAKNDPQMTEIAGKLRSFKIR